MAPDGLRAYVLAYPESTSSGQMPRVYVFDTTALAGQQSTLPVISYKTLTAFAACAPFTYVGDPACAVQVQTVISTDGKTLFFVGEKPDCDLHGY